MNFAEESANGKVMKVLRTVGKVLMGLVLGYLALMLAHLLLGVFFGFLQGSLGWPVPSFMARNLILLAFGVVGYILYRNRRKQKTNAVIPK